MVPSTLEVTLELAAVTARALPTAGEAVVTLRAG
jgi:hypothetical protein